MTIVMSTRSEVKVDLLPAVANAGSKIGSNWQCGRASAVATPDETGLTSDY